ncbi:MAG: DUF4040 domain-containing protein [Coriobacteriia bacterium]|nr:DUF4040 domain-containing protein [Coriobacteriia bacterium]
MLFTAVRSLAELRLFKSVVLFIAFGLLAAFAWVRLGAPDIALAEAAIGTGITGVLMLDAVGHMKRRTEPYPTYHAGEARPSPPPGPASGSRSTALAAAALALGLAAALTLAELAIPEDLPGLAPAVAAHLGAAGVENPVTAVLLNFRGYDTLLEIGVLVLAALGVLSLRGGRPSAPGAVAGKAGPVLSAMTRLLAPVMIVVAGYLLWAGAHAPGGAFQAGSVLGAAGVLLSLSGYVRPVWIGRGLARWMLSAGFLVFLAIAAASILAGGRFLEYPAPYAKSLMLAVETVLTLSIAAILVSLFIASAAPVSPSETEEA